MPADLAVGLPEGQMGNSEVGHLNMGAGRIVYQELTRITKEIEDGDFFENAALVACDGECKGERFRTSSVRDCYPTAVCTATSHIFTDCLRWQKR